MTVPNAQMPSLATNGNYSTPQAPPGARPAPNPNTNPSTLMNAYMNVNGANPSAIAQNRAAPPTNINPSMLTTLPSYSASTQEILRRFSAQPPSAGSPEWEAARREVLKSMASTSTTHTAAHFPTAQGTRRTALGSGSTGQLAAAEAVASTPTEKPARGRGAGRGRPRGSRARGGGRGGRGGKRKREESEADENDTDASEKYTPQLTVTKSGRNIQKPSQFNPAVEASPTSGGRRRRSYRRGPEFTLCVKCQRGHSPASNMIVFCDGCNSAYHQWCHDPLIPKEVVEIADKEWFCGKCRHTQETEKLKLEDRVSGQDLTIDEKSTYLSTLSSSTLIALLLHATTLHPPLPIFAPNTRSILQHHQHHTHRARSASTPLSSTMTMSPPNPTDANPTVTNLPITAHHTNNNNNNDTTTTTTTTTIAPAPTATSPTPSDPYPDYANLSGDPPATYPRPGAGPIKLSATTDPEDLPWLMDEDEEDISVSLAGGGGGVDERDGGGGGFEVFSHLVQDDSGALVPVGRGGVVG